MFYGSFNCNSKDIDSVCYINVEMLYFSCINMSNIISKLNQIFENKIISKQYFIVIFTNINKKTNHDENFLS